jgi:hypothetical protein
MTQQGRHGRFLSGKDAIVAATSLVCRCCPCHFLFLKIQPRTKPWLPCLQWQPCSSQDYLFTFSKQESRIASGFIDCHIYRCVLSTPFGVLFHLPVLFYASILKWSQHFEILLNHLFSNQFTIISNYFDMVCYLK